MKIYQNLKRKKILQNPDNLEKKNYKYMMM